MQQCGPRAASECPPPEPKPQVRAPESKCPGNESPVLLVSPSGPGLVCGDISHRNCLVSLLGVKQNGCLRNL